MTPQLPDWIRGYTCGSFTNIYELCPDETRLYGVESLYGDWDGEVLLLAQDFAPRQLVLDRIADPNDRRPFRHSPKVPTNTNLQQLADPLRCGKLYGNALGGLLRNSDSDALPSLRDDTAHLLKVLRFACEHMPNLRGIACLGTVAWDLCTEAFGIAGADRTEHMNERRSVDVGGVLLFAHAHPARVWSNRGKANAVEDWRRMAETLDIGYNAAVARAA